jgi:hypothetical protein
MNLWGPIRVAEWEQPVRQAGRSGRLLGWGGGPLRIQGFQAAADAVSRRPAGSGGCGGGLQVCWLRVQRLPERDARAH